MSTAVDINEEAAAWLAREDAGLSPAEVDALAVWLAESTSHRVAYLRLNAAWARADRLSALGSPDSRVIDSASVQPARLTGRRVFPRHAVAASIATLALGVLAAILFNTNKIVQPATYRTDIGGREFVPLADGSKVELNTDTRLRATVSESSRVVWLDQGEAYFEITHDEVRPFVVIAGPRRVTVLGTKFSVRRDGDDVQVNVVEGRVAVDSVLQAPPISRPIGTVGSGEVMITKQRSALVMARGADAIRDVLSWRQGLLVMDQWTLGQAANEFNRYNRRTMTIAPSLAEMRLGGSFEATNVDAFARILKEGFGLKVQFSGDRIVVSDPRIPD